MTATTFAVHFLSDGGFVVRGTMDVHEALALVVDDEGFDERFDFDLAGVAPPRPGIEGPDYKIAPEAVAQMADRCYEWIKGAKPGLYRMNPASIGDREDERITWWLRPVDSPGRGVWRGVLFP